MSTSLSREPEVSIEADPNIEELSDISGADDQSSYTSSVTSSIMQHIIENGRRYHAYKDGTYYLPNDEVELDRLDFMHQLMLLLLHNKLHFAPIERKPIRILDVGTGTGIWAIDMGDEYPEAEIIGTDISPTQPSWVPPKVKFIIDDCEEPWSFQQKFDYIHVRYMIGAIKNWPKLVRSCYQNIVPGGWVEFQEFDARYYSEDGTYTEDSNLASWVNTWVGASSDSGKDPHPGSKLEGWVRDAGFQNIEYEKFRAPVGPWPRDNHLKKIGLWNVTQLKDGLDGFTLRLYTQVLGWKVEDVKALLNKVRKDLDNPKIHSMYNFYVVYGQKPTD